MGEIEAPGIFVSIKWFNKWRVLSTVLMIISLLVISFLLNLFILAMLGPHCGSRDLRWGMQTSKL